MQIAGPDALTAGPANLRLPRYCGSFVTFAPSRDTSAISPFSPNTNATTGLRSVSLSYCAPAPLTIATPASTPIVQSLLFVNWSRAASVMNRMTSLRRATPRVAPADAPVSLCLACQAVGIRPQQRVCRLDEFRPALDLAQHRSRIDIRSPELAEQTARRFAAMTQPQS